MFNKVKVLILAGLLICEPSFASKTPHIVSAVTNSAGNTRYIALAGAGSLQTPDSTSQVIMRSAGTFDNLKANISANSDDGTLTITMRKNAANGTLTVSIATTLTGLFEDTTHSDTASSGDAFNWGLVSSGTTGSVTVRTVYCAYAASSNTVQRFILSSAINSTVATTYIPINGAGSSSQSVEGDVQFTFKAAGTLKNESINITANTQGNTVTYQTRKGAANGNLAIAVTAAATGSFEDTTHTDTVTAGDLWNMTTAGGDTTHSITARGISVEFVTTNGTFQLINGNNQSPLSIFTASVTQYIYPGTIGLGTSTTESQTQVKTSFDFTASNLSIDIVTNGGTTNGTFDLRQDTGSGPASTALTVSITALTTGIFSDDTHTVSLTSGDKMNLRIIPGATADTSVGTFGFMGTGPATAAATHRFFQMFD